MRIIRNNIGKIILVLTIISFYVFAGCSYEEEVIAKYYVPYPDYEMLEYYQSRVDSSEFEWFLDLKSTASSFANEMRLTSTGVSTSSVIIKGEGIFHGLVEVELPDMIYELEMERPYQHLGRKSIWQVIAVREIEWPVKQ
jgi:hypothetical protein